jgi:hypothetical protein
LSGAPSYRSYGQDCKSIPPSLSIAPFLLLALIPGAPALAQAVGDDGALGPEEIEAARSAPLFQTDDVLEFTLHADFNTIRRQDREEDAEERTGRS